MEQKLFRVKARQFRTRKTAKYANGEEEYFFVPDMRADGKEFEVRHDPENGEDWYRVPGFLGWNYHKSWLIFLDTVSKGDE